MEFRIAFLLHTFTETQMAKMLTTRLTDGVWNLPHTIPLLNGFLEPKTKQLIASPG